MHLLLRRSVFNIKQKTYLMERASYKYSKLKTTKQSSWEVANPSIKHIPPASLFTLQINTSREVHKSIRQANWQKISHHWVPEVHWMVSNMLEEREPVIGRISQPKVISQFLYMCSYPTLVLKATIGEVWALYSNCITGLVFHFLLQLIFSTSCYINWRIQPKKHRGKKMSIREL